MAPALQLHSFPWAQSHFSRPHAYGLHSSGVGLAVIGISSQGGVIIARFPLSSGAGKPVHTLSPARGLQPRQIPASLDPFKKDEGTGQGSLQAGRSHTLVPLPFHVADTEVTTETRLLGSDGTLGFWASPSLSCTPYRGR